MMLLVDSLEVVRPMAALLAAGCEGLLERKLRGGMLSCEVADGGCCALPLLLLHPLEERFLICSLDKAGDGGAFRGPPAGLSKGLVAAGDCSRSTVMMLDVIYASLMFEVLNWVVFQRWLVDSHSTSRIRSGDGKAGRESCTAGRWQPDSSPVSNFSTLS